MTPTPGQLLHARREAAGLTVAALAKEAMVTQIALTAFEADRRTPSKAQQARLNFALRGTP